MQLYSHTLTLITISVCVLHVNTRCRVKHLSFKQLVLGPKLRKAIWSRMQLYSHKPTLITISVCLLRVKTRHRVITYILNGWSWDQSEEYQYSPECNFVVTH
jgi:hypothetical protein